MEQGLLQVIYSQTFVDAMMSMGMRDYGSLQRRKPYRKLLPDDKLPEWFIPTLRKKNPTPEDKKRMDDYLDSID